MKDDGQNTVFYTRAAIAKMASERGWGLTPPQADEMAGGESDGNRINRHLGGLDRIAEILESINSLLEIALQPLLEQTAKRHNEIDDVVGQRVHNYVKRLEAQRGPMPLLLRKRILHQLREQITLEYNITYAKVPCGRKRAFILDGNNWHMVIEPPCGTRSKTRAQYNKWIKQKVKRIAPHHAS